MELAGECPFTEAEWNAAGKDECPLSSITYKEINQHLRTLPLQPHATSTSIRDIFHQRLFEQEDDDPVRVMKFTGPKALRSAYQGQREMIHVSKQRKSKREL